MPQDFDFSRGNNTLQAITEPNEFSDERGLRMAVELLRCADLLNVAGLHDGNPVSNRERLLLVMRHKKRRNTQLGLDSADLLAQLHSHFCVERGERLVEQQNPRFGHKGAGERYALLLATAELVCVAIQVAVKADHRHGRSRPISPFHRAHLARPQAELHVLDRRQVREQ